MFPSSRNTAKLTDFAERPDKTGVDIKDGEELENPRSRFLGERANRRSVNERDGRDTRESWTIAREKRPQGQDDDLRQENRFQRREKDPDIDRRNGLGEKHEGRWGEQKQIGERRGGWRDRDREREWEKGAANEKEPEWMDDPTPAGAEDDLRTMGMPRNQEQFQRWKEAMSGRKAPVEEVATMPIEAATVSKDMAPTKTIVPLKLEGIVDKPFGSWNDSNNALTGTLDVPAVTTKPAQAKGRASRFASMFKEAQPKEDIPPLENVELRPTSGAPMPSAEDEAGFKRILQMLGGTGTGPAVAPDVPSSPPTSSALNGMKQKSRFTGFFDQSPKSPQKMQSTFDGTSASSATNTFNQAQRTMEEPHSAPTKRPRSSHFNTLPARTRLPSNITSPEPPSNGGRQQQTQSTRSNDVFLEQQPPSRGAATPDISIQNLLASQRAQKAQGQDKNSEFLLNLLQTKSFVPPAQQARGGDNFSLWLDQPPAMPEQHAPKPRGAPPPPGFIDEQLSRNAPQDSQQRQDGLMAERRTSQRAPPGFYNEQAIFLQSQQQYQPQQSRSRVPTESGQHHPQQAAAGRRMSGHPQPMQIPQNSHQAFPGAMPSDFRQSPPQGPPGPQVPPPGFNAHMTRHPPGFQNMPNVYQQPPGAATGSQQRNDIASLYSTLSMQATSPLGMSSPPSAPPGFYPGAGALPGMPQSNFMGLRSPVEGMPASGNGIRGSRGYEGVYDGPGMGAPRR